MNDSSGNPVSAGGKDRGDFLVLLSVGLGTFMSALDASAVNTVLPVMRAAFGSPVGTIQWVITVYLMVMGGLLLAFGRLGDLRGHRRVYLAGFAVFVPASVLCGISPSEGALIAARVVQGLGAAVIVSNSPAILVGSVDPARVGRALGLQAAMTYLGLTLGPSLGGWLTDHAGWRSIFFINVPVGAVAVILGLRHIPHSESHSLSEEKSDLAGISLFMGSFFSLLAALNRGSAWGWGSPAILFLFIAAAALGAIFVLHEMRTSSPMLDLSLFRNRIFSVSVASALVNYVCVASVLFLTPFYLIQGRGLSAALAGLVMTAQSLAMVVVSPLSGMMSDRIGSRGPATAGLAIMGGGLFIMAGLDAGSRIPLAIGGLLTAGFGNAIFVTPNSSAMLKEAPKGRHGIASGILATSRLVGMTMGVGLAGAIMTEIVGVSPSAELPPDLLFKAIHLGFLFAGTLAMCGAVLTASRGKSAPGGRGD